VPKSNLLLLLKSLPLLKRISTVKNPKAVIIYNYHLILIIFVYREVLKPLRHYPLLLFIVVNKVMKSSKDASGSNLDFIF